MWRHKANIFDVSAYSIQVKDFDSQIPDSKSVRALTLLGWYFVLTLVFFQHLYTLLLHCLH